MIAVFQPMQSDPLIQIVAFDFTAVAKRIARTLHNQGRTIE